MTTYRKFDRFRSSAAFVTDELNFISFNANDVVATGTGTPAVAQSTNGGLAISTSAANNDSAIVQRGIGSAATKITNIIVASQRKFSVFARVTIQVWTTSDIVFGVAPAVANPATSTAGAIAVFKNDGTFTFAVGGTTVNGEYDLASAADALGGVDLEVYHDGTGRFGLYVNGVRIAGVDRSVNASTGAIDGVTGLLSATVGVISRTAAAKTLTVSKLCSALQICENR